jgi:hypothetical protein
MPEITPPIFVLYKEGRVIAFDEVFEAEMTPIEHFERIDQVLDSTGRELRFEVKQRDAIRLEGTRAPDEGRLRELLTWALQGLGDIDVGQLPTSEITARAVESFRLRKKDEVELNWADAFATALLHLPIP